MIFLNKNFKKLVIFFSKDGNTRHLAQCIAQNIEADIYEIKLENELEFFNTIEKKRTKKFFRFIKKPIILDCNIDFQKYDLIFIGSPIWFGKFALPLYLFLEKYKFTEKSIALFCSYSEKAGKSFYKIKKKLKGNHIVGLIGFQEPLMFKESKELMGQKIGKWAAQISNEVRDKIASIN